MPRNFKLALIWCILAAGITGTALLASEHRGVVKANGIPVPGVAVTATQGDKKVVTTTDENGIYDFKNLDDGIWSIQLSMLGFAKTTKEIGITPAAPPAEWELKLMSLPELKAAVAPPAPPVPAVAAQPSATPSPTPAAPASTQPTGTQRGGRGGRQAAQSTPQTRGQQGFQRVDVNQSQENAESTQENLSTELVADLNTSANDSFLVNGSV